MDGHKKVPKSRKILKKKNEKWTKSISRKINDGNLSRNMIYLQIVLN